ncbi:MAG: hypothetical protein ABIG66_03290 [Candidatus Kerfeldbacteria bacterium]
MSENSEHDGDRCDFCDEEEGMDEECSDDASGGLEVPGESSDPRLITTDEDLKVYICGPPDAERCAQAFRNIGSVPAEQRPMLQHFYYQPKSVDIQGSMPELITMLNNGGHVLVPMRERSKDKRSIVHGVLKYLTSRVLPRRIFVANCGSTEDVLQGLAEFWPMGVVLTDHTAMLSMIDWDRLLPILSLDRRPETGKGITILSGMLGLYLLHRGAPAVIQHDADLRNPEECDALAHLAYPLIQRQQKANARYLYVKTSRAGRGNETCMTARNILGDIASNTRTPPDVAAIAVHLNRTLREHKWMCSGEFGLFGKLAYNRPYATGYLEETLISIFVEECIRYCPTGNPEAIAQVQCPKRLDDSNNDTKEFLMQDRIARFLVEYCWFGKPVVHWTLEDYASFNRRFGSLIESARIPTRADDDASRTEEDDDNNRRAMSGPVIIDHVKQDRIIPSVKDLFRYDLIRMDMAEEFMRDPKAYMEKYARET